MIKGERERLLLLFGEIKKYLWAKLECMLGPNRSLGEVREVLCLNSIFGWSPVTDDEADEAIEIPCTLR